MKTNASVTIKQKVYHYTLEKTQAGAIRMISKDAKIDQEFLTEDVSELILDIPSLIIAEQKYVQTSSDVIRFHVTTQDRKKIEKRAVAKGYTSISSYVRAVALGGE